MNSTRDNIILENCVALADHHREHCLGEQCDISLSLLLELLRRASINVPQDLVERFM